MSSLAEGQQSCTQRISGAPLGSGCLSWSVCSPLLRPSDFTSHRRVEARGIRRFSKRTRISESSYPVAGGVLGQRSGRTGPSGGCFVSAQARRSVPSHQELFPDHVMR
jgi:hypothetical protein